jgi:formylglycine-generating enzyme required for sulfatase activity
VHYKTSLLFSLLLLCACAFGQSREVLEAYARGPHTGTAEQALVGIEVTSASRDGAVSETRRGNGFVLRCDGFILAPAWLFPRSVRVAGQYESVGAQSVTVTLSPGTERAQRVTAKRPRYQGRAAAYVALKLEEVHLPALRTLLPDTLQPGDTVQVIWSAWSASRKAFQALERRTARLAALSATDESEREEETSRPGFIAFTEPLEGIPAGAAVIGPDGMVVGMVGGSDGQGRCEGFYALSQLSRATNCVTPLPTPDPPRNAPMGEEAAPMVAVAGGPVRLPASVLAEQPDMEGARIACVAPFQIDTFEVTNAQYLAFWRSLPERDRRRLGFQSQYYPLTWAKTEPPFPASLANAPVVGVPLPGASAYARWMGKRLPTPYEWCLAALGPGGDSEMPEWARQYVSERRTVWMRVREMHIQYLRERPELQQGRVFTPSPFRLPWINQTAVFQRAAAWSKQTIEAQLDPLWRMWRDPLYLLPVGSRGFDVSPYGAADMILNAYELVAPYPGAPTNGAARYMAVVWTPLLPARDDPWWVRPVEILTGDQGLPPLSRLYRRTLLSPPAEEIMLWSNLSEVTSMLVPLSGWRVAVGRDYGSTGATWQRGSSPYEAFGRPAGLQLWQGMPRYFRQEMGRPVPLHETDGRNTSGPQLFYYLPVGFRCAR